MKVLLHWSPEVCIDAGTSATPGFSKPLSATTHVSLCFFFFVWKRNNKKQNKTKQDLWIRKWKCSRALPSTLAECRVTHTHTHRKRERERNQANSFSVLLFQDSRFEIYDLRFDCRYSVKAQPVCGGRVGAVSQVTFHTPSCGEVLVYGDKPDCPTNGMFWDKWTETGRDAPRQSPNELNFLPAIYSPKFCANLHSTTFKFFWCFLRKIPHP